MNTTTQTPFDSASGNSLAPEMEHLLQMTNQVVIKIKEQTKEMYQ
jgi:hypothetical protein